MNASTRVRIMRVVLSALALGVGLGAVARTHAQSGGEFNLRRVTIDSGGGISTAAGMSLTGTIGQPDVGAATGPNFEFQGGFWASTAPATTDVLLSDGFESP